MITSWDIKEILSKVKKGTCLTVPEIQALIKSNFNLSADDYAPHTTTRPTRYPKWCHRIQGVLSDYKRKGLVTHDKSSRSYTFY
jgi:hypothetical protein